MFKMGEYLGLGDLVRKINAVRDLEMKVVLTGGTFDDIGEGHHYLFRECRRLTREEYSIEDNKVVLVVNVVNDERVKFNKGEHRPVRQEDVRAKLVAGTVGVDYSTVYPSIVTGPTIELATHIKPDVIVQDREYLKKHKKKMLEVLGYDVKILGIPRLKTQSTTDFYKKVVASEDGKNNKEIKEGSSSRTRT